LAVPRIEPIGIDAERSRRARPKQRMAAQNRKVARVIAIRNHALRGQSERADGRERASLDPGVGFNFEDRFRGPAVKCLGGRGRNTEQAKGGRGHCDANAVFERHFQAIPRP
jgi:hypothetical protein